MLDILFRIVAIIANLFTIGEKCVRYIRHRDSIKKSPSESFPAADGRNDDLK